MNKFSFWLTSIRVYQLDEYFNEMLIVFDSATDRNRGRKFTQQKDTYCMYFVQLNLMLFGYNSLSLSVSVSLDTSFSEGIHFHVLLHNDYWPVKWFNSRACRRQNDSPNSFKRKYYKPIPIITATHIPQSMNAFLDICPGWKVTQTHTFVASAPLGGEKVLFVWPEAMGKKQNTSQQITKCN